MNTIMPLLFTFFIHFYSLNVYDRFVNSNIVYIVKWTTFEVEMVRTKTMMTQTQLFWLTIQGSSNDDYNYITLYAYFYKIIL